MSDAGVINALGTTVRTARPVAVAVWGEPTALSLICTMALRVPAVLTTCGEKRTVKVALPPGATGAGTAPTKLKSPGLLPAKVIELIANGAVPMLRTE
ncbi:unannotated protein [freshwater metagenome]|uniref:Unannotated protein n=1 Tax=freshwater metagenome TaxID=449393 RepID=A0A6J6YA07_9ZZZZ